MGSTRVVTTVCLLAIALLPASSAVGSTSTGAATKTIAFEGRNFELWVTRSDGRAQRPLTSGQKPVPDFAWSPDGRRIAFKGARGLQLVNADGSGLRRLVDGFVAIGLAWSPDSRRLAYTDASDLFVVNVSGGTPRRLAPAIEGPASPSWSPRGTTIAFATSHVDGGPIYAVEADGSRLRTLTKGGDDSFPSWSPDGSRLLFQRYTCPAGSKCGYEIHVVRADGSGRRRLTRVPHHPGVGLEPAWSPDGRRIAFNRPSGRISGDEIMVIDADGRHLRSLTKGLRDASGAAWSPDGRRLVFESSASIYVTNADGSGKRRVVEFGRIPAWRPSP